MVCMVYTVHRIYTACIVYRVICAPVYINKSIVYNVYSVYMVYTMYRVYTACIV